MGREKLTDDDVLRILTAASEQLGDQPAETERGETVLKVARSAISMLILGLEGAIEDGTDTVPGILKH